MKISEVITLLAQLMTKHGDKSICVTISTESETVDLEINDIYNCKYITDDDKNNMEFININCDIKDREKFLKEFE